MVCELNGPQRILNIIFHFCNMGAILFCRSPASSNCKFFLPRLIYFLLMIERQILAQALPQLKSISIRAGALLNCANFLERYGCIENIDNFDLDSDRYPLKG